MYEDSKLLQEMKSKVEEFERIIHSKNKKIQIVVAGNVKAGKSSLINALTEDENLCEVGVVRTTSEVMKIEHNDYFIIDTPGINANENDTETAEKGYKQADFILFVHNAIEGELLAKEIELLNELKSNYQDSNQFAQSVFIVLTNAHQLEDEELNKTKEEVQRQIKTVTEKELSVFTVDSVSYMTALKDNKKLLMSDSGIPALQQEIEKKSIQFRETGEHDRDKINQVKKDRLFKDINLLYGKKNEELMEMKSLIIDIENFENVLRKIGEYPKQVVDMLSEGKKVTFNDYAWVNIDSSKIYKSAHDAKYKSRSRAESAGLEILRSYVIPAAENSYIKTRQQLIRNYKELLPENSGEKSLIFKQKEKIEAELGALKEGLLPFTKVFDLSNIADESYTINIHVKKNEEDALIGSSYLYAAEFDNCYDVESASWYDSWIDVEESFEYKKSLFGEKEIDIFGYNLFSAREQITKHLNSSTQSAHNIIKNAFQRVYQSYADEIEKKVKKIIAKWMETLKKEMSTGMKIHEKQQQQIVAIENEISEIIYLTSRIKLIGDKL